MAKDLVVEKLQGLFALVSKPILEWYNLLEAKMSLDVTLRLADALLPEEPQIFIREAGRMIPISRIEWDQRCIEAGEEGKEPVLTFPTESDCVFTANITHNLAAMADQVNLYKPLWRPDEIGITKAKQLIEILTEGLFNLRKNRYELEKLNPKNGWGTYEGLVSFVKEYLQACINYPEAEIEISR